MHKLKRALRCVAFIGLVLQVFIAAPISVAAASDPEELVTAIAKCGAIPMAEMRLACFDALSHAVARVQATNAGSVASHQTGTARGSAIVSQSTQRITKEKPFRAPEPKKFSVAVMRVENDERGRLLFFLDNRELWRQTSIEAFSVGKKFPKNAEISKGLLGSYAIVLDGYNSSIPVAFLRTY